MIDNVEVPGEYPWFVLQTEVHHQGPIGTYLGEKGGRGGRKAFGNQEKSNVMTLSCEANIT